MSADNAISIEMDDSIIPRPAKPLPTIPTQKEILAPQDVARKLATQEQPIEDYIQIEEQRKQIAEEATRRSFQQSIAIVQLKERNRVLKEENSKISPEDVEAFKILIEQNRQLAKALEDFKGHDKLQESYDILLQEYNKLKSEQESYKNVLHEHVQREKEILFARANDPFIEKQNLAKEVQTLREEHCQLQEYYDKLKQETGNLVNPTLTFLVEKQKLDTEIQKVREESKKLQESCNNLLQENEKLKTDNNTLFARLSMVLLQKENLEKEIKKLRNEQQSSCVEPKMAEGQAPRDKHVMLDYKTWFHAVQCRDIGLLQSFLNVKLDINATQGRSGNTALHLAAAEGDPSISPVVVFLLQNGIDVGLKNRHGETALQIAQTEGCKEVLYLIDEYMKAQTCSHKFSEPVTQTSSKEVVSPVISPATSLVVASWSNRQLVNKSTCPFFNAQAISEIPRELVVDLSCSLTSKSVQPNDILLVDYQFQLHLWRWCQGLVAPKNHMVKKLLLDKLNKDSGMDGNWLLKDVEMLYKITLSIHNVNFQTLAQHKAAWLNYVRTKIDELKVSFKESFVTDNNSVQNVSAPTAVELEKRLQIEAACKNINRILHKAQDRPAGQEVFVKRKVVLDRDPKNASKTIGSNGMQEFFNDFILVVKTMHVYDPDAVLNFLEDTDNTQKGNKSCWDYLEHAIIDHHVEVMREWQEFEGALVGLLETKLPKHHAIYMTMKGYETKAYAV
eukprot:gene951-875_t